MEVGNLLAVSLHPLLSQKAEEMEQVDQEPTSVAEAPEVPETLAPEPTSDGLATESATPEAPGEELPALAPDVRKYLDPTRYYQELTRLEREDPEFRNALLTRVGRHAAKEWKPKLANLEAEVLELREKLRQEQLKSLEPDEVKERLYQDPEFRKQFDGQPNVNPALIRQRAAFEQRVNTAVEYAEQYLPSDQVAMRVQALSRGAYDAVRDQAGNVLRVLAPEESLSWFERDLNAAAIAYVQQATARAAMPAPAAPAPVPQPAPVAVAPEQPPAEAPAPVKSNPALAKASPDLSQNTSGRSAAGISLSEYRLMSTPDKMRLYPQGLEAALQSGAVYRDDE